MKKFPIVLCLILCLPLLFSCGQGAEYQSQSFFAMDTLSELRIYSDSDDAAAIFADCKSLVLELEAAISITAEDGDLYRFNASEEGIEAVSRHLSELIRISEEISDVTEGAFDVRTGALIELWKRCESEGRLPDEGELAHAAALVGSTVALSETGLSKSDPDMKLNFGAIGKGYASDLVAERLRSSGVSCGMISFVSTVTVFGERPSGDFKIAIRRPDTSGELAGYITMKNASLSVSGNYERYYEIDGVKYDHILDPETGYPAGHGIDSAVVICQNGAVADALSTAITVMGAEETLALYESGAVSFEAAMFCGEEILVTDGFSEAFSLTDETYRIVLLSDRY